MQHNKYEGTKLSEKNVRELPGRKTPGQNLYSLQKS
jgi:hypothetical protein